MIPDEEIKIGYQTELDRDFAKDLYEIEPITSEAACSQFQGFIDKWQYWLDDESKELEGKDWIWLCGLVQDCRKESLSPEEKHLPAMALLMPEKILKVSIIKSKFHVPWGCAYIRMKEEGVIKY